MNQRFFEMLDMRIVEMAFLALAGSAREERS